MDLMGITITINGRPLVQKNSKMIARGKLINKPILQWQRKKHLVELLVYKNYKPIKTTVNARIISYISKKSTDENRPDLGNISEYPQDLLQQAGMLKNDNLVATLNGSRIVFLCDNCPKRPIIKSGKHKGERKDSCGKGKEVWKGTKKRLALCPLGLERYEVLFTPAQMAVYNHEEE